MTTNRYMSDGGDNGHAPPQAKKKPLPDKTPPQITVTISGAVDPAAAAALAATPGITITREGKPPAPAQIPAPAAEPTPRVDFMQAYAKALAEEDKKKREKKLNLINSLANSPLFSGMSSMGRAEPAPPAFTMEKKERPHPIKMPYTPGVERIVSPSADYAPSSARRVRRLPDGLLSAGNMAIADQVELGRLRQREYAALQEESAWRTTASMVLKADLQNHGGDPETALAAERNDARRGKIDKRLAVIEKNPYFRADMYERSYELAQPGRRLTFAEQAEAAKGKKAYSAFSKSLKKEKYAPTSVAAYKTLAELLATKSGGNTFMTGLMDSAIDTGALAAKTTAIASDNPLLYMFMEAALPRDIPGAIEGAVKKSSAYKARLTQTLGPFQRLIDMKRNTKTFQEAREADPFLHLAGGLTFQLALSLGASAITSLLADATAAELASASSAGVTMNEAEAAEAAARNAARWFGDGMGSAEELAATHTRLLEQFGGDAKAVSHIEAAYDYARASILNTNSGIMEAELKAGISEAESAALRDTETLLSGARDGVPNAFDLKNSGTVQSHMDEFVAHGEFKGEPARSYVDTNGTNTLLDEIIHGGTPVKDKYLSHGLRWDVPGTYRGSYGVWELVIDLDSNTIVHFNFKSK